MMISPEGFIEQYRDKAYLELIQVRDDLIEEIKAFEGEKESISEEWIVDPSSEVQYQCNLQYLGKLCDLISEKYNQEYVCDEL